MGFFDRIRDIYKKIDERLGGILPGGVPVSKPSPSPSPSPSRPRSTLDTPTERARAPSPTPSRPRSTVDTPTERARAPSPSPSRTSTSRSSRRSKTSSVDSEPLLADKISFVHDNKTGTERAITPFEREAIRQKTTPYNVAQPPAKNGVSRNLFGDPTVKKIYLDTVKEPVYSVKDDRFFASEKKEEKVFEERIRPEGTIKERMMSALRGEGIGKTPLAGAELVGAAAEAKASQIKAETEISKGAVGTKLKVLGLEATSGIVREKTIYTAAATSGVLFGVGAVASVGAPFVAAAPAAVGLGLEATAVGVGGTLLAFQVKHVKQEIEGGTPAAEVLSREAVYLAAGAGGFKLGGKTAEVRSIFSKDLVLPEGDKLFVKSKFKDRDFVEIKIAGGVESTSESLAKQATLAGKTVDGVSGQRSLFSPFKKKITIDKPMPEGVTDPLESSFFIDPRGNLRTSRLGDEFKSQDSLTGSSKKISFFKEEPQAVLFERTKIEEFPVGLKDVETALLKGKPLTSSQRTRLAEFQQEPSGQFKPIGFVGKELEATLPKSEVIAGKRIAVTFIEGKRVPVYGAEIKPASYRTTELMGKKDLTPSEFKELNVRIFRESRGISGSSSISGRSVSPFSFSSPGSLIESSGVSQSVSVVSPVVEQPFSGGSSSVRSPSSGGSFPSPVSSDVSSGGSSGSSGGGSFPSPVSSDVSSGGSSGSSGGGSFPSPVSSGVSSSYYNYIGTPTTTAGLFAYNRKKGNSVKSQSFRFFKQPKSYTPTAFSAAFGIKGKSTSLGITTGLGLRPVKTKKKKLKGVLF